MKICIPTVGKRGLDVQVGGHFGRVPTYIIVDTETNEVKIIDNASSALNTYVYIRFNRLSAHKFKYLTRTQ